MSKTYNKYVENRDHTWYDSTNIIYSVLFDVGETKSLKIVFKGGRTYLYKNVEPQDYVLFRDAESNGIAFNTRIRKYDCVRQEDTSLDELEKMKQDFMQRDTLSEYRLHIDFNNETGEFKLNLNDNIVYEGVEGQVSIINLFKSMKLEYTMSETESHNETVKDFEEKPIVERYE